jgi:hypothetical protein
LEFRIWDLIFGIWHAPADVVNVQTPTDWNANGLERRRPRLHECEARKGPRDVESAKFDAAEATALQAGTPAFQSHPPAAIPNPKSSSQVRLNYLSTHL